MDSLDPTLIDSLRARGVSYTEIGRRLGTTKDAARGRHVRYLAARDAVPALSGAADVPPASPDDSAGSGGERVAPLPTDAPARSSGAKGSRSTPVKSEIEMARAAITKATRAEIRLKHSLLADEEINREVADRLRRFDRALQDGVVLTVELVMVSDAAD